MAAKHQGRLFAIGDIHACPDELDALLKAIDPAQEDTVIFVGDYVDRGPSARDVIDCLIDFKNAGSAKTVFLKGNHEDMMLDFMGLGGHYGEAFLFNGGLSTFASYGIAEAQFDEAIEHLPELHLEFLRNLETSYVAQGYLFVHAGVQPLRALEDQDPEDLLWIRQEFIFNRHRLEQTVIFGHTPMRDVMLDLPYKIGVDTGLVYGGKLSAIELTERKCYQVARGSKRTTLRRLR